jgi:8-oxo-dGTP pyrophosphatase MutT (NUDIX family)
MSEPASHVEVQPAATVMLVRDVDHTGLEVLMLRRHPEAVFAADAWVFPGGRVDDGDRQPGAGALGPSDEEASAALGMASGGLAWWVAAARELFEEAGILLARHAATGAWLDASSELGAARLARYRREVHSGVTPLAAVLEAEGLVLDLSGIHYVSHWITPPGPTARRFDTRFFLAEAPPGQVASHDAAETVESFWASPGEALARGEAGEIQLLIPTVANLKGLARFSSVAELVAAARSIGSVPVAAPRFRGDPSVPTAVLPPSSESSCPT